MADEVISIYLDHVPMFIFQMHHYFRSFYFSYVLKSYLFFEWHFFFCMAGWFLHYLEIFWGILHRKWPFLFLSSELLFFLCFPLPIVVLKPIDLIVIFSRCVICSKQFTQSEKHASIATRKHDLLQDKTKCPQKTVRYNCWKC